MLRGYFCIVSPFLSLMCTNQMQSVVVIFITLLITMNNIRGLVVGQRSVFNKLSKSNAFARLLSVKGKIH